jgi:hypothetical protein
MTECGQDRAVRLIGGRRGRVQVRKAAKAHLVEFVPKGVDFTEERIGKDGA